MNDTRKQILAEQFTSHIKDQYGKAVGEYLLSACEDSRTLDLTDVEDYKASLKEDTVYDEFIHEQIDPVSFVELIVEYNENGEHGRMLTEIRKLIDASLLEDLTEKYREVQADAEA